MTLVEIEAAIDALEKALSYGELTGEYAGRRFTYKSTDDLMKAIEYFKRRKDEVAGGSVAPTTRNRTTYAAFEQD